jgi:hypothetical protein
MNKDIRKAVDMAIIISSFVDELNSYKVTIDDINDIGFFKPDVINDLNEIKEYVSGKTKPVEVDDENDNTTADTNDTDVTDIHIPDDVYKTYAMVTKSSESDDNEVIEIKSDDDGQKTIPEIPDKNRQYVKLNEEACRYIAGIVADKYDGENINNIRKIIVNSFPSLKDKTITRFLRKETYSTISDEYYTLIDGRIVKAVCNRPVSDIDSYIDNLINSIPDQKTFYKILADYEINDPFKWRGVFYNLAQANYDMDVILNKCRNMDADALITYEIVKRAMVMGGLSSKGLSELDMTIILSSIIKKLGKRKISRVLTNARKQWGICNVRTEQVFAVMNKTSYPEIVSRFGI